MSEEYPNEDKMKLVNLSQKPNADYR